MDGEPKRRGRPPKLKPENVPNVDAAQVEALGKQAPRTLEDKARKVRAKAHLPKPEKVEVYDLSKLRGQLYYSGKCKGRCDRVVHLEVFIGEAPAPEAIEATCPNCREGGQEFKINPGRAAEVERSRSSDN